MIGKLKRFLNDEKLREMAAYVLFGVLTTLVNWAVYFALTNLFDPGNHPAGSSAQALTLNLSNAAAWMISVLFAFFTNKKYVFKSSEQKASALKEFTLFVSARVLSYLLFDLLIYNIFVFGLALNHGFTKILMNVLVVIFNYFASRFVVFRQRP